ncbi:heterokaryon incompatibility protein-domain-containing protein [Annulohypoxylon maeteangense]|uniref:heterokaryon incompatibility protein-domain-containing protein n=1 Tax=Annulohypoxylon maeteangense TaxID=1927788 RepID=UPI0020077F26|nr:heterokaryon incompatibility protein-domain-containing protein [Annulohypoxylon maeteangense]KAI0882629.1 heterokaryon incompatibility protein-domain-containing protein [Annulohypoxylon maeteangense]
MCQLQRYDDPDLSLVKEFKYIKLPNTKMRIRLLRLKPAAFNNHQILCEFIEADYDNAFHVPTKPNLNPKKDKIGSTQYPRKELEDEDSREYNNVSSEPPPTEEDAIQEERIAQYRDVEAIRIEYEALSWCWGTEPDDYAIIIEEDGMPYKRRIKKSLALALKYLRYTQKPRTLWIDSICINQEDDNERNHQVQMMSRIYTRAEQVCIWLGESNDDSKAAIKFIKEEVIELKHFDLICSDKTYGNKWQALLALMQRSWFSRRWMVQEIALARKATIYCGPDEIPWDNFAVAVELFVEVETATHRLSEVMQKDEKFRHIPGWFEHVSELGASLLVQATGKIFRTQSIDTNTVPNPEPDDIQTIDPLKRRSLLSLQYLVTTMFIFQTSEPRDAIYSLLAVARDTSPFVEKSVPADKRYALFMRTGFSSFLEEKPFHVDYGKPYYDVCRDFVEFSIHRGYEVDKVQTLDILCRPWALEPPTRGSTRIQEDSALSKKPKKALRQWLETVLEIWYKKEWSFYDEGEVRVSNEEDKDRRWEARQWKKKHFPHLSRLYNSPQKQRSRIRNSQSEDSDGDTDDTSEDVDIPLPSWIPLASSAPFALFYHPGMDIQKAGRVNADPLVGVPRDRDRNYSAAQTEHADLTVLKFRKRLSLGHYSLYVKGFIFDEVAEVMEASQGGSIPTSWLKLGGWKEPDKYNPPDEFWRTLVADRGKDNKNPPYYYARACKESAIKGGLRSGGINTTALINDERNSIIAEFCRRVQAVIWNRRLFKTKGNVLGLASSDVRKGDKVGIIYGCTVPVILRERQKGPEDTRKEKMDDTAENLKTLISKCQERRRRKLDFKAKGEVPKGIKEATEIANKKLKELLDDGKPGREEIQVNDGSEEDAEKNGDLSERAKNEKKAREKDPLRYYRLIGESYIHGMMDGEAVRRKFYGDIPDQIFELR